MKYEQLSIFDYDDNGNLKDGNILIDHKDYWVEPKEYLKNVKFEKSDLVLLKFFKVLLNNDLNNVDALLMIRDMLMTAYENNYLTESEHCDIEAIIDEKLRLL